MVRRTLLFYFLQCLPLLVTANTGLNATIANCIDFDMVNVEKLMSSLRSVKYSEIKGFDSADEDKEKNQPFGYLKTDWSRLQLLQEALPMDSLLKDKFKHIFRFLFIAHEQATRFLDLPESTTVQDSVEKQTTISLINKNDAEIEEVTKNPVAENEVYSSKSQKIGGKSDNISTTPTSVIDEDVVHTSTKISFYELRSTDAEFTADDGDAVEMKEITEASTKLGEAKNNNVPFNTTDSELPMNSSTTIGAPISILEATKLPTAGSILNASTTISDEAIHISTSIHEESEERTGTSLSESTSANEEVIFIKPSTKMGFGMKTSSIFDNYIASTTESILKEVYEVSSNVAKISSLDTTSNSAITKVESWTSSFIENDLSSTTERPKSHSSLQPALKMDPVAESSTTEKYPSPATISSIAPTENFTESSVKGNESILGQTQTESTSETENYSPNAQPSSKIPDSGTSDSTKVFTTESTSIDLMSTNNEKETSESEKSTSSEWSNKNPTESEQITTPTLTINEKIKSTSQSYERTVSMNDKSTDDDNEAPSTSTSTSAINTSSLSTNTVELIAGTSIPDSSHKTMQYFASMEPSIKTQQAETSTRNYVSEQSTITPNKIGINMPTDGELTNLHEVSEADLSTENGTNNPSDLEVTSKKSENTTTVSESPWLRFDSETWRPNSKPSFVKNPLNTGSSRSNKIFQDFKHESEDTEAEKNSESPQIVLYETGAGAKTGSVWRPHLVRQQPTGNNIWRFDSIPNNFGPYGYGHKQPTASPIDSKAGIPKDEENPTKFPGQGSRMNLLRSRKRGSANSDVEKQFRWFYRHGRTDTAPESRDKERVNTKIKIQCKNAH